jgi:aspartyl protease family protein
MERPARRQGGEAAGRARPSRRASALAALLALAVAAHAQTVTFNGTLGDRALLVVDGKALTVPVGGSAQGVKLIRLDGDRAQVEVGGKAQSIRIGGSVAGGGGGGVNGSRIILPAGPGGHYMGTASVNGHPVQFLVDTGATLVAISSDEAARLGLDYASSTAGRVSTANGSVGARMLTLSSVRVGDVTLNSVPAVVVPQPMPYMLLGNSFLSRFVMHSDSDGLVLDKK